MIERSAVLTALCKEIPEIESKLSQEELALNLKEETRLNETWLNLDSIDTLEIVMTMEETFDVEIQDSALDNIFTVSDLIDVVVEAGR